VTVTETFIRQCLEPGGKLAAVISQYESRPQQLDMAIDIFNALLNKSEVFLAEAGTGTGKSLAYLIPIAALQQRAIVSTGTKNLQEQLITKDIPLLNKLLDKTLHAVLMKGRSNYLCLRRYEEFALQPAFHTMQEKKRWLKIRNWAEDTDTGDRAEIAFLPDNSDLWHSVCSRREECFGIRCPHYRSCFLLRLKIQAQAADLVVVNHHLYFADTTLRKENSFSTLPPAETIVFDEAHLLEEIATQFLGSHLSHGDILDFVKMIRRWKPGRKDMQEAEWRLEPSLRSLEEGAKLFFDSMPSGEGRFPLSDIFKNETERMGLVLVERLNNLRADLHREGLIPAEFVDEWKEICRMLSDSTRLFLERSEPAMAWWGEHTSQGNALHATPVDISGDFSRILKKPGQAVILTSATLTMENSFDFLKERLGLPESLTCIYPSPFDYARQGILYLPQTLPYPDHPDFYAECAKEITRILDMSDGRAFILTTSYAGMEKLRVLLNGSIAFPLFVQGDEPKRVLIEKFRSDIHSVLLATISFWQGVDVPGESLSAVIIDKLPFASPADPVTRAKVDYFRENGMDPFSGFQVPSAVMMLKQGIGRLIRSRSDRGLVAVLDQRILTRSYGRKFLRSLPGFSLSRKFEHVRLFFNKTGDPTPGLHQETSAQ
jgi:ATP-dependent DNA helicase DinG